MAKKVNQKLLNEELNRFKRLFEYSFYSETSNEDDDLILGSELDEADEDPNAPVDPNAAPADPNAPVDDSKTAANAPVDPNVAPPAAAPVDANGASPAPPAAPPVNPNAAPDGMGDGMSDGMSDGMGDDMESDDVEVDVTELVQSNEAAKQSSDETSQKTDELLSKFNDLERRVSSMDKIASKIDTLEKEFIKRNPTPIEKLEMRSMDSFPYSIKLTDYWKDLDGYETNSDEEKNKEYVLTKDDVDSTFVDSSIKNSFNVPDEYEEEDI